MANGQIAELANDWDGYMGTIPKSSATVAEVLKDYGYNTAAWGKWHNTPALETTAAGPFNDWPTGYGFEYFYGFLARRSITMGAAARSEHVTTFSIRTLPAGTITIT